MVVHDSGATVTILFSDLVSSTELLQRAGDESAQRIFQAHHRLLQDAVSANGGHEVKWLGDGLMVAFPSAADAVRCAIAMQQSARGTTAGERLEVRVGLNVGEAFVEESDYFGTPVVMAKRLCDDADAGQILCSSAVAHLLAGRQAFQFREVGEKLLKGLSETVQVSEVLYEAAQPGALLRHIPFVGREKEASKLQELLQETRAGQGGLVMLVGEPGIGKTRLADEFAESARNAETTVLWGRCYEGEWAPPYGPFAEAIAEYARTAVPAELTEDLGVGAAPIARLVPSLKDVLPDIEEPVQLEPEEERFRLLDAVSQFFIAASERAPLVLMLDDLHWSDKGSIDMLRHLARYTSRHRLLVLGTYRDVELDRKHPLAEALGALRRETSFERILLKGLDAGEVGTLISTLGERDVPETFINAISEETDGNPFFIREVLWHLVDTEALYQKDGEWTSDVAVEEMGIPEGVREVIGRRLSLLSADANGLLTSASAFSGPFRFDVAGEVAGLEDVAGLDALDSALDAQIIRPTADANSFTFAHALIRQTLYGELSPPRQVRLHRQVAEGLERAYGDAANDNAAELAYQYHRSSTLPGVEPGIEYALVAADRAEAAYARDDTAMFLSMTLELMPAEDERRPRVLARLALALAWTLQFDEAVASAEEASDLILETEGEDAAADFLAEAVQATAQAGYRRGAWQLAAKGLRYVGKRRDATWAHLFAGDLVRREAEDPDNPGIPLDTPERRELLRVVVELPAGQGPPLLSVPYRSRERMLAQPELLPFALLGYAGEYRRALSLFEEQARECERTGQIANAAGSWGQLARCHNALGNFADGDAAYERGQLLSDRLSGPSAQVLALSAYRLARSLSHDENWDERLADLPSRLAQPEAENQWAAAAIRAAGAVIYARTGHPEEAVRLLPTLVAPLERAPSWAVNYTALATNTANALWDLERTDHIDVVERSLLEKVITPDFRYPMMDARLSMAYVCALTGRYDEAQDWFTKARSVLEEQGARPLRAIADFDEAQMHQRRGEEGDTALAAPLLEAALTQFRELGMTGWIRRAEELQQA